MKMFAAMLVLAASGIAVSGDAPAPDDEAYVSEIDIGRLSVINQRTQEIWLKLRSDVRSDKVDDPGEMSSTLRYTVWDYNALREQLCSDRFMVEKSCGPPYVPKWMFESPRRIPSMKELAARQGELSERIEPLWDAACERLKKVVSEDDAREFCSIE